MTQEQTPRARAREQQREFRRIVANAVGELRSQEIRDTYAALSMEELIDQHIERLEGSEDALNPSRLQRIRRIRQELVDNIEAMKETPPDSFRRHDPEGDANTAPEDDES